MGNVLGAVLLLVFFSVVTGMFGVLHSKGKLDGLYSIWINANPAVDRDRASAYITRFFLVFAAALAVAALLILALKGLWPALLVLLAADAGFYIAGRRLSARL